MAPESGLALKPPRVRFEEAAAVPTAGLIALMNLRDFGKIQAGQHVLVNGACGGVGSMAVLLAKAFDCTVTAVDRADKLAIATSLGADHVIDFEYTDFTQEGVRYDLIFDIPGNHSFAECKRALRPTGVWVLVGHDNYGHGMRRWVGSLPRMFGLMARASLDPQLPRPGFTMPDKRGEMAFLHQQLEAGKLTPHIDRVFSLEQAAEAIRYLESGQAKGRIMLGLDA